MCTNLIVKAQNGDVVVARSMDFANPTGMKNGRWEVGHKISDKFKVDIGFVGKFSELGPIRCVSDGVNDKGLSIGSLWLPSTQFATKADEGKTAVDGLVLMQALLGTCTDVTGVETFFKNYTPILPSEVQHFATVHFSVVDQSGASKVIEIGTDGIPGSVHVYDNPIGVVTNAPEFPWQLRNLSCYTQIGLKNTPQKEFNKNFTAVHTGFGANQLGLPGDAAPQSRFVRATTLLNAALAYETPKDANAAMKLLDKVIGQVTVIKGVSADVSDDGLKKDYDYTQWVCMKDLRNKKMYVREAGDDVTKGYAIPVYEEFK